MLGKQRTDTSLSSLNFFGAWEFFSGDYFRFESSYFSSSSTKIFTLQIKNFNFESTKSNNHNNNNNKKLITITEIKCINKSKTFFFHLFVFILIKIDNHSY